MKVNLCFEIHHPLMLKKIDNIDDIRFGKLKTKIFDHETNRRTFDELKEKTYLPTLKILKNSVDALKSSKKDFKFSINVSGIFLDYSKNDSDIMEILKELSDSGNVDFIGSTYYHSLAGLMDMDEFRKQTRMHSKKIKKLFNQTSLTFVNPDLIFNTEISHHVKDMGFNAIITEGDEKLLGWRNPNFVYIDENGLKVLLRNKSLSNDITLRFSSRGWNEWPLTAEKYAYWLSKASGECVNIYLNMRNFGHYHDEESGIFWFLGALPSKIAERQGLEFSSSNGMLQDVNPVGEIKVPENEILSWSGLSPVNGIQKKYLNELKDLGLIINETNNKSLAETWRMLQVIDTYKSGHGLHNLSNILEFMRMIAGKMRKEPHINYFSDKLSDLEFVSDSLRRRSID
jgi:alpha-amylase